MLKNKSAKNKTSKESLKKPEVFIMTQSNTEELKNARSATTGEKFDTLDERIDCEVDRLNKKIEVSFLQQEDKESHAIENSIEGLTTDIVVKGRTLHNLSIVKEQLLTADRQVQTPITMFKPNTTYTQIVIIKNNTLNPANSSGYVMAINEPHLNCIAPSENIKKDFNGTIIKKFITTENINQEKATAIRAYGSSTSGSVTVSEIILEGDWTNKPIPNYFEGIKSFGQQEDKISILSSNKNLFNLNEIGKNFNYKEIENGFEISNTEDVTYPYANIKKYMFLKKGTYTFSYSGEGTGFVNVAIRSKVNSDSYSGDIKPNIPKTFTMDSDKEVVVTFYLQGNITTGTYKNKYTNIQLVEGSKSLNYEPYKCDKKDILLSDLGFDEGLRGLSSTVYDELNNIRNVTIKRIDKYKLTGEEEIYTEETIAENNMKFVITTKGTSVKPSGSVISDNFIKGNDTVSNSVRLATNNKVIINIDKTKLSEHSVEGFKTWLKTNPTTVYYELAEPVETPLDENINVKTFGERTYISFENAISGTSSFKAPVNTVDTIARLNRENRALEEENKTLRQDFESTTLSLTDSDLELVKQNVDMDFRLMEVEFALDIPQAILSSNIKFKNKKGEVKSMARTPYEMMKIVILSGDYDREDYIHKVGKYYERGRMTKEEHDELMSLMTADEVISK